MLEQDTQDFQDSPDEQASYDSVLASLDNLTEDGEAETEEVAESEEVEESEEETETDTESEEELDETEEETEEESEEPEPEEDPKATKAIERIQLEEKQSRARIDEHLASERAEVETLKADWTERIAKAEASEQSIAAATKRAKYDPAGALEAFGVTSPEEMLAASRQLHALAVAGTKDATPAMREMANRSLRERETEDRISRMESENTKLREEMANREQHAATEQSVNRYLDNVVAEVSDSTPLISMLAKNSPDTVRQRIHELASDIASRTGEAPDAEDVLKIYENAERKALSDRGIDPDLVVKSTKRTKKKNPATGEKNSVSLGNNLGTPTTPKEALDETREETEARVLREIEAME